MMFTVPINYKKTMLPVFRALVFFFVFNGCNHGKDNHVVTIEWDGQRPKGISIPLKILPAISDDSIGRVVSIQLANKKTAVLGEYYIHDDVLLFRPVISFTRGLKYEIRVSDKLVSEIEIPVDSTLKAPEVGAILPTSDTVPLNLLKIHILFSKPMQEGQSMDMIRVIRNRTDTIPSVFLDLQPELWNKERTMLTLWLDPGRIKTDLQPNKTLGLPLQLGASYQILIRKDWRNIEGIALANDYRQNFVVGKRDSLSPDIENWSIHAPKAATSEPLKIEFKEPLDYILLRNAVHITDDKGNVIDGDIETGSEEKVLVFIPNNVWNAGKYWVEVESRLEDLAGNNLNRLFDKDLSKTGASKQKAVFKRSFQIQ